YRTVGRDLAALLAAVARPKAWGKVGGARMESRSTGNHDASARAVGRSAISVRQEARGGACRPTDASSSRRQDRQSPPGQISPWPDGDGAGALRRSPLGNPVSNAASADFGDGNPRRDREALVRAVLANHPDEKTISLLAISVSN